MKVITLDYPLQINKNKIPPVAIALGYFDGVHLGHQKVILTALHYAKKNSLKSAVMTFDPHPSVVLKKDSGTVQNITPIEDKMKLIEELGIDFLFIVHFTEDFASLHPQEFVDQYIIGLNVKHVVAGFDYTYGRMGKGTMETLPFHSRGKFTSEAVSKLTKGNGKEKVSSTLIRNLLQEGNIEEIQSLLGRFYTTKGLVIHGDKRGRTIGFPTANVEMDLDYMIPPVGVYAVKMKINGDKWYQGVCNIGYKPTFKNKATQHPSVEVHLFDFHHDIYGERVEIEWHKYLRTEQKFSGIEELIEQINKDKVNALSYFDQN